MPRKLPRVLILWGVPGTGKSTFAKYLVKQHGYLHVESDAGAEGNNRAAQAWRVVLDNQGTPAMLGLMKGFVKVARYEPHPVVLEYGMRFGPGGIFLLGVMRDVGAEAWWIDGDHGSAFAAWKAENAKNPRRQHWQDSLWHSVVADIKANYPALKAFFGTNSVRTIEAGPLHVPPEDTFKAMFGDQP